MQLRLSVVELTQGPHFDIFDCSSKMPTSGQVAGFFPFARPDNFVPNRRNWMRHHFRELPSTNLPELLLSPISL
ncbi:MAG: hypothetical protein JWQ49_6532 [Edaphobacter sp.]|nr:hypothetical protein [Edaphobacter sp.]